MRKLKEANPEQWKMYHSLPPLKENIAQKIPDKHNKVNGPVKEKSDFLTKDGFVPAYLELARTMKDDFVYGKPNFDLYYIGLKPEQVNVEFGGKQQPFRVIL